ncbi:MAG: hypothetical protein ACFFBP_23220 [Promethearchaeota archaeon]
MTIYEFNIITTTGFPYYGLKINETPDGVRIFLRFFDFSKEKGGEELIDPDSKFELTAGLISAIFEFSRAIDRKIYMLEFQSEGDNDKNNEDLFNGTISDTLITCSSETFLSQKSIRDKIELIYNTIIEPKLPLMTAEELLTPEIDMIKNILNDKKARDYIDDHIEKITDATEDFLIEMNSYGLEGICILSFDLSLIQVFGEKFTLENVKDMLRNTSQVADIPVFGLKHRIVNYKGEDIWLYVINSGIGVTEKYSGEELFEPYYYLLICKSESYLGDFPNKLMNKFREILKK